MPTRSFIRGEVQPLHFDTVCIRSLLYKKRPDTKSALETCTCLMSTSCYCCHAPHMSLAQSHDLQCSSIRMSCAVMCSKETRFKIYVEPMCDAERNSEAPAVRPSTSCCTVNVTRCRGTSRGSSPQRRGASLSPSPWRRDIRENELNKMWLQRPLRRSPSGLEHHECMLTRSYLCHTPYLCKPPGNFRKHTTN